MDIMDLDIENVLEEREKVPKRRGRPPKNKSSAEEKTPKKTEAEPKQTAEEWREAMRHKWGSRFNADGGTMDYSDAELRELENLYAMQAAEFKGAVTPRVEIGLVEICSYRLELKRCIAAGDSAGAKRYSDMINSAMGRESMKAGDAKALEATRIDALIMNLEAKGAIKDGKIVGTEELIDILAKDHPKYHTSRDVVYSMLFAIINTMKRNNGENEITELPLSAQIEDVFDELLTTPTQKEKKALADTGIVPPPLEQRRRY